MTMIGESSMVLFAPANVVGGSWLMNKLGSLVNPEDVRGPDTRPAKTSNKKKKLTTNLFSLTHSLSAPATTPPPLFFFSFRCV